MQRELKILIYINNLCKSNKIMKAWCASWSLCNSSPHLFLVSFRGRAGRYEVINYTSWVPLSYFSFCFHRFYQVKEYTFYVGCQKIGGRADSAPFLSAPGFITQAMRARSASENFYIKSMQFFPSPFSRFLSGSGRPLRGCKLHTMGIIPLSYFSFCFSSFLSC